MPTLKFRPLQCAADAGWTVPDDAPLHPTPQYCRILFPKGPRTHQACGRGSVQHNLIWQGGESAPRAIPALSTPPCQIRFSRLGQTCYDCMKERRSSVLSVSSVVQLAIFNHGLHGWHGCRSEEVVSSATRTPNQASAGNGAGASRSHAARVRRAVP